jgi:predicted NBD/HSP70 family sugar kinase
MIKLLKRFNRTIMSHPIWGIDLGGTKIEGVILTSLDDARPIVRRRIATEGEKGYRHVIDQVARLVDQLISETGIIPDKIGFGTPGVLDPMLQTMKNCNSTSLNGMPLHTDLAQKLGIPVVLANDANCFALAETHWGIVKKEYPESKVVFGIIMGTGVGGGIVCDGHIWAGRHGIAGEWGHNFLDESGGSCYCGKTGCVETVLSGPGLQKYYQSLSGQFKNLREITVDALSGKDPFAVETIERLHNFFGKGVSAVINLLDPDIIIVGGGVGNIESIYSKGRAAISGFIFNDRTDVPIVKPVLGDSGGVFGAAALVA